MGDRGYMTCKICGMGIAGSRHGMRKHYRKKHRLRGDDLDSVMSDVPSTKDFLSSVRAELGDDAS